MGLFLDKRLDVRYVGLLVAMSSRQSVILRQCAKNRSEEVAFGRFVNNPSVTPSLMIQSACERTAAQSKGRDVLMICDTSTVGFGINSKAKGLSEIGDGRGQGFFLHPVISMDAHTHHCLGLASAQLYDRKQYAVDKAQRRRDRNREKLEEKESYRWYEEIEKAVSYNQGAKSQTVVADREADIYELLVLLTALGVDFVIRSSQNRKLKEVDHNKLQQALDAQPLQGQYSIALPATDKRTAHTAELEVKWVTIDLARPRSGTGTKHLVDRQKVTVIEVREKPASVVGKEKPIYWRLLTSHSIQSMDDALRIIGYYVQRWVIEQVFRTLKKKGMDVQSAQVSNAAALKNLTVLALISSIRVMQLVQARDEPQDLGIEAGFEPKVIKVIERINPQLEGNTEKLKNPYPPNSLSFAAWVVARLGGWSGYASQRPAGPITMWNGLRRLNEFVQAMDMLNLHSEFEGDVYIR
ncbi:IS4 family transposase [Lewinella sp. LCG006]|uniref:IS4 family transposase n=2 Tax=Lewinella sp. LCG006 TaxID=3231911 RepID=UPI003461503A